jgi:hypothetical protein
MFSQYKVTASGRMSRIFSTPKEAVASPLSTRRSGRDGFLRVSSTSETEIVRIRLEERL